MVAWTVAHNDAHRLLQMDSLTLSASETLCSAGAPPQERILHGPPPGAAYMDRLQARLFYYMYTCMLFEWLSNGWARTPRFAAHTRLFSQNEDSSPPPKRLELGCSPALCVCREAANRVRPHTGRLDSGAFSHGGSHGARGRDGRGARAHSASEQTWMRRWSR
jgi:hypothetical protein